MVREKNFKQLFVMYECVSEYILSILHAFDRHTRPKKMANYREEEKKNLCANSDANGKNGNYLMNR